MNHHCPLIRPYLSLFPGGVALGGVPLDYHDIAHLRENLEKNSVFWGVSLEKKQLFWGGI